MLVTNASVGRVCSCHHARPKITRNSFSKKNKRTEWNCTSSPSLNNAADYKGGGVASPQASWIFGTARDHEGTARKYLARHGSTRSGHGTARDVPDIRHAVKKRHHLFGFMFDDLPWAKNMQALSMFCLALFPSVRQ